MNLKKYYEKLAQLTLPIINFNGNFIVFDKPDLQDNENCIGIEVTNVESEEEGILRGMFVKYAGQGLTSNDFRNLLRNPKIKQKIIPDNKNMVTSIKSPNVNILILEVLYAVCVKTIKFKKYKKFNKNGLYLFCLVRFLPEYINFIYDVLKYCDFPFDFYILNIGDKIYYMDKTSLTEYNICQYEKQLRDLAYEYAN